MKLNLQEIERVKLISKKDFYNQYVKKQKPVIIEQFTTHWPAYTKWNLPYIKKMANNGVVPLYDDTPVTHKDGFNEPRTTMPMDDYIDLLLSKPTNYRIFAYNFMRNIPSLRNDIVWPDLGLRLIKQLPMLFFGGQNSRVFMHYDIDYPNILHFHFHGKKQCVLFPPSETPYLYKVPHALIALETIDFDNPDFTKFPNLAKAKGFVGNLNHGDMLYMPEGYWHYMKYLTAGFSMTLRAYPNKITSLTKAGYNLIIMRNYDMLMRKLKGQKWIDYKNTKAMQNAENLKK